MKTFLQKLFLAALLFCAVPLCAQSVHVSSIPLEQVQETYGHFLKGYLLQQEGYAQSAVEEYSQVLDLAPQAASIYQDRARLNYSLGKAQEALGDAQTYLQNNPDDLDAYLLLASIYVQLEQNQEAQKYLELARKKDPKNLQVLLLLASILEPDHPKQALQLLQNYQSKYPNESDVLNHIAALQQKLGQKQQAQKTLDRIVKTNPDSVAALVLQGQRAQENGQVQEAIRFYELALQQVPYNNLLRTHLLGLNAQQKNYQNIVNLLMHEDQNPEASDQHLRLLAGAQQMIGQNKQAIQNYLLLQSRQDQDDLRFHLAYLYGVTGQGQKTIEQLEPLIQKFPKQAQLYFLQGLAYKDLGEWKKALKKFNTTLELEPDYSLAHFQKASVLDSLKRWEESEQELRYVVEHDTSNAMAANYLGYNYVNRAENLDRAQELIARALALDPDNPAYLDSMGWLHYVRGDLEQAQVNLERAAKLEEDPIIYEHLADCYLKQQSLDLAWSYFFSAQKLDPKNKRLQKKLDAVQELKAQRADALHALDQLMQNTAQLQQVSGVMTFVVRAGPAQLFGSNVGQAAFYLRRLASNFGDFLQVKLDFPQAFPAVGFNVYYQTPPQEEWRIFPPEAQRQIPEGSKFIFEVVSAFFNGDLFTVFDDSQIRAQKKGKLYELATENETLQIDKKRYRFLSWSLPDMKLTVEKYQKIDGKDFPKVLRLSWKISDESAVWNVLDIHLTQVSFQEIKDEVFE